jgi:AcrR family transcriptional regulator
MAKNADACTDCDTGNVRKTAAAKIFDAALDLFYRRGVRGVGVDEIVCEAGVTKPSLYRAFKSKDDLVAACLRESAREGRAALDAALTTAGDDPLDRLDALIRFYSDKFQKPDFRGCLMSNVAVELTEPGHPGREVLEDCKGQMRATVLGLVRDLHVAEPEALADGILLVIEGAIATHHVFGSQGPTLSMTATCRDLIDTHLSRRGFAGVFASARRAAAN